MKAITILEPWATLICEGKKTIETRNWDTLYRGKILIHASKRKMPDETYEKYLLDNFVEHNTHPGCIIGEVELIDIIPFKDAFKDIVKNKHIINYCTAELNSQYAWIFSNAKIYEKPIPAKGNLGLWEYTKDL